MIRLLTAAACAIVLGVITAPPVSAQAKAPTTAPSEASAPLNLNTATQAQLEKLPGIGPSVAARILEYRQKTGFKKVEDLMNVRGVGEKSFLKLKPLVTLGPAGPTR